MTVDPAKAIAHGLTHRPLETLMADTLAWYEANPHELKAGLTAEREQELLAAWTALQAR
ncbi:hypothetical protein D3C86_2231940 [compost metagenome]